MSYCTTEEVVNRYGDQVTTITGRTDEPDATRMTAALSAASNLIDMKISSVVDTPLDDVPATIKELAIDLTWYYLKKQQNLGLDQEDLKDYDNLITLLDEIRDGKVNLFGGTETANRPSADFTHRTRYFGRS